jgi:uncharacterized protein (TIGR02145 family)
MGLTPMLVAPFNTGLSTDVEPWLSPPDSFRSADNVHIKQGYIEKRAGYQRFGQLKSTATPISISYISKYRNGDNITSGLTNSQWGTTTSGAVTAYDNNGSLSTFYGNLYNWYAAAGIVSSGGSSTKNICPSGWHVPTDSDWNTLISSLGTNPGTQLKENSSLLWTTPGSNTSGFSARPGGYRYSTGNSADINSIAYFWERLGAGYRSINNPGTVTGGALPVGTGASVRCLKDGI